MAQAAHLTTRAELDYALRESAERPVVVFKHSLVCSVSAFAYQTFQDFVNGCDAGEALFTLVEIQKAREVSDEIARVTGVQHQSPQVLVLRDGRAVWSASHWDISAEALAEGLAGAAHGAG